MRRGRIEGWGGPFISFDSNIKTGLYRVVFDDTFRGKTDEWEEGLRGREQKVASSRGRGGVDGCRRGVRGEIKRTLERVEVRGT